MQISITIPKPEVIQSDHQISYELLNNSVGEIINDKYYLKTTYHDFGIKIINIKQKDDVTNLSSEKIINVNILKKDRNVLSNILQFKMFENESLDINLDDYKFDLNTENIIYTNLTNVGTLNNNILTYIQPNNFSGIEKCVILADDGIFQSKKYIYFVVNKINSEPIIENPVPNYDIFSNENIKINLSNYIKDNQDNMIRYRLLNSEIGNIFGDEFFLRANKEILKNENSYLKEKTFNIQIECDDMVNENVQLLTFQIHIKLELIKPILNFPNFEILQDTPLIINLSNTEYINYESYEDDTLTYSCDNPHVNIEKNIDNDYIFTFDNHNIETSVITLFCKNEKYSTSKSFTITTTRHNYEPILTIPDMTVFQGQNIFFDLNIYQEDQNNDQILYQLDNSSNALIFQGKYLLNTSELSGIITEKIYYKDTYMENYKETTFNITINKNPKIIEIFNVPDMFFIKLNETLEINLQNYILNSDLITNISLINGPGKLNNLIFSYKPLYSEGQGIRTQTIKINNDDNLIILLNIMKLENNIQPELNISDQIINESTIGTYGNIINQTGVLLNLTDSSVDLNMDSLKFSLTKNTNSIGEVFLNEIDNKYYYKYISNGYDNGVWNVSIDVFDGSFTQKKIFKITINQINNIPDFNPPSQIQILKNESVNINLDDYSSNLTENMRFLYTIIQGNVEINDNILTISQNILNNQNSKIQISASNSMTTVVKYINIIIPDVIIPIIDNILPTMNGNIITWNQISGQTYDIMYKNENDSNFNILQENLSENSYETDIFLNNYDKIYNLYILQRGDMLLTGDTYTYQYSPPKNILISTLNEDLTNENINPNIYPIIWNQ